MSTKDKFEIAICLIAVIFGLISVAYLAAFQP